MQKKCIHASLSNHNLWERDSLVPISTMIQQETPAEADPREGSQRRSAHPWSLSLQARFKKNHFPVRQKHASLMQKGTSAN